MRWVLMFVVRWNNLVHTCGWHPLEPFSAAVLSIRVTMLAEYSMTAIIHSLHQAYTLRCAAGTASHPCLIDSLYQLMAFELCRFVHAH